MCVCVCVFQGRRLCILCHGDTNVTGVCVCVRMHYIFFVMGYVNVDGDGVCVMVLLCILCEGVVIVCVCVTGAWVVYSL